MNTTEPSDEIRFETDPNIPGLRCLAPRCFNLNSARMLWHEAVRNAFLQIQEANPFSARLVGRFISESRFSLWVQRRF
jgi:hypothetical protein